MKKLHFLLVENQEEKIGFFIKSLDKSGLSFLCSKAGNLNDALINLKNDLFDCIFINAGMLQSDKIELIKKIKVLQKATVVYYSTLNNQEEKSYSSILNYVQLPESIDTMARVLRNLFIDNDVKESYSPVLKNEEVTFVEFLHH